MLSASDWACIRVGLGKVFSWHGLGMISAVLGGVLGVFVVGGLIGYGMMELTDRFPRTMKVVNRGLLILIWGAYVIIMTVLALKSLGCPTGGCQ